MAIDRDFVLVKEYAMANSPETPLHVYQVLEEEYISLHGAISEDGLTVELPDQENENTWRPVEARRDWRFHQGHIKDPVGFASGLLLCKGPQQESTLQNIQSFNWMKTDLKKYLLQKIDHATLQRLCDWQQGGGNPRSVPAELTRPLEQEVSELLKDPELYHRDRFTYEWLSDASKRLIHLRSSSETFQGDALAQLNRLLLEDAFPESLEKINDVRLAAMYQRFHTVKQKALCLSGGGIRSGTFALGLLQGLARHNLLNKFDYLSTVSGGGYIGSWLTAWIHRQPKGLGGVTNELANSAPASKIDPDPPPVHYLREYSSFLTPKVGLLTADTWTFLGIYFRNLLLNWLVFIPLLIAVLTVPRLVVTMTLAQPEQEQGSPPVSLFGLQKVFYGRHIFLAIGFVLGVWALAYIIFNRPGIREMLKKRSRFWGSHANQRSFLLYCLLPLIISAAGLTTYWAWSSASLEDTPWWKFLFFGVLFTFLGWLVASLILRRVFNYKNWKDINFYELGALLVAGIVGGILLWLMSGLHSIWENPVVGYANLEKTGQPFPWTYWSTGPEWTWPFWTTELYACFAVPVFMLVFLAGAILFVGLSSVSPRIDDEDREWWSRFGAWVLIAILTWCVSNTLVIFGPVALMSAPTLLASVSGLSGLLAILLGRSSKTPAQEKPVNEKEQSKVGRLSSLLTSSLPLLALVFIAALVAALSLATTGIIQGIALLARNKFPKSPLNEWLTTVPDPGFSKYVEYVHSAVSAPDALTAAKIVHMNVLHHTSTWFVLALGLLMFGFGMVLARFINLNLFSLHAGYRNRLIRAFLGASRPGNERNPNPFTGFDPADDIHMHELRPGLFDESDFIDPVRLARELLDETQPMSRYLSEKNLLQNLNAIPLTSTASPRLTASLRNDLNGALESASLYMQEISQPFLQARRIAEIWNAIENEHGTTNFLREESLRSDYHLLLNRLILEEAYPNTLRQCQYPPPPYKLLHVVNTTLNLVGGHNLAWQQRKAETFSVTPLHSGCFRLGYRNSRVYGGGDTGGISIGTAAAISGAAASSNMGYYTTSPVISLLLTFFNVRLGWWLGNPGPAGDDTYDRRAPKYSVSPIISEAFGLTDDLNKYVYLTDGGHFENLAIYEMILRRCHIIVVSDGAQDENYRFSDLGNAVRKIRIDFSVPIEFTSVPIYAEAPRAEQGKGMYWAIGKIRYTCIDRGPNVQDGVLLYIKPAVYGNEPRDILEYKKSYPAFPHQSTADQFFDEPQFESYRMLGSHIMDQLCGKGTNGLDLYAVIAKAVDQLTDDTGAAADSELKDWLREWLRKSI
jgi:hypothetical protein